MEHLAQLLYVIADWNITLFVLLIFAAIGLFSLSRMVGRIEVEAMGRGQSPTVRSTLLKWLSRLAFVLVLPLVLLSFVNIIRPHALDGEMVYRYGRKADAKVLSKENTNNMHNNRTVERYHVIYKTEAGETIETSFDSWDFNIYPSANSVNYPDPGEQFRVAYLPSYPRTFVILTEEQSPYVKSGKCDVLLAEIENKRNKFEFDPKNTKFTGEYMSALAAGIENDCGDHLMEELRSIGDKVSGKTK